MSQQAQVVSPEISQLAAEISQRIANLESLFEENLDGEMDSLKACLRENPSAAALLLDEDVGLLVKNLKRTASVAATEAAQAKASGKKKPAASKVKLTPEQIQAALDAEDF